MVIKQQYMQNQFNTIYPSILGNHQGQEYCYIDLNKCTVASYIMWRIILQSQVEQLHHMDTIKRYSDK